MMEKYKVMVSCATHMIEFMGDIVDMDDKEIIMELEASEVVINRQFVVYIQTVEEKPPVPQPQPKPQQEDKALEFIKRRLRHDPVEEKMVPMSQLPDQNEELVMPNSEKIDEEDLEAMRQVQRLYKCKHPITQPDNLADAIKGTMNGENNEFAMQAGGVQYANPLQTVMKKYGNTKKTRTS